MGLNPKYAIFSALSFILSESVDGSDSTMPSLFADAHVQTPDNGCLLIQVYDRMWNCATRLVDGGAESAEGWLRNGNVPSFVRCGKWEWIERRMRLCSITHRPKRTRFRGLTELGRTTKQWRSYVESASDTSWVHVRCDMLSFLLPLP